MSPGKKAMDDDTYAKRKKAASDVMSPWQREKKMGGAARVLVIRGFAAPLWEG